MFKSDDERDNMVYTNATQRAVRKVQHELVSRYDMKKLFLIVRLDSIHTMSQGPNLWPGNGMLLHWLLS